MSLDSLAISLDFDLFIDLPSFDLLALFFDPLSSEPSRDLFNPPLDLDLSLFDLSLDFFLGSDLSLDLLDFFDLFFNLLLDPDLDRVLLDLLFDPDLDRDLRDLLFGSDLLLDLLDFFLEVFLDFDPSLDLGRLLFDFS